VNLTKLNLSHCGKLTGDNRALQTALAKCKIYF